MPTQETKFAEDNHLVEIWRAERFGETTIPAAPASSWGSEALFYAKNKTCGALKMPRALYFKIPKF
jgi:hypothetical protein